MNPYALISLFSSILSLFLGNFIYYKNPKNKMNQLVAALCFLVAYLAFVNFSLRGAESYYTAYLWLKASVLWPLMTPVIFNIVLIATKNPFLKNRALVPSIYIIAVITALIQFESNQITNNIMVLEYWGWTTSLTYSPILYFTILWVSTVQFASITLCYRYYKKSKGLEKHQTLYILLGLSFVVISSLITDTILPLLSVEFPGMIFLTAPLGLLFISYGVSRYKLPDLTPAFAADEIVSTITNFLIITDENRKIRYINPVGLKLLGYGKEEFEDKNIEMIIPHTLNSKILAEECLNNFETILKDKKGENIPVLLSKSVISKKSTIMGILYMGTDIRERRAVEMRKRAVAKRTIARQNVLLELYREDISDLEKTLKRLTETCSKTLDVDRVSVWFFNREKTCIHCSDLYSLQDDCHESGSTLKAENYPRYFEALGRSRNVTARNASTDPKTSEFSDFYLKSNNIVSMMDVPVWIHGAMVGVLCHETTTNRDWSLEDQDFAASISYMVSLSLEASKREEAQKQITHSLEEKEILLREVHHRVKNNMQIISSLLNLQSNTIKNKEMKDIFKESQNRVRSMSMIHEEVYQSDDIAKIDFRSYIKHFIKSLFQTYPTGLNNIEWVIDIDEIKLNIETSIPCGLILNELLSNSLKHAFKDGKDGKIWVKLNEDYDKIRLAVTDNGTGLPDDFQLEKTSTLGLELVKNLVKQLDGKIKVKNENGVSFIITFRELDYKERT